MIEIVGGMKLCKTCGVPKPATMAFFFPKRVVPGRPRELHATCKACRKIKMKEWALANLEKRAESSRRWRAAHPEKARAAWVNWKARNRRRVVEANRARYEYDKVGWRHRNWVNSLKKQFGITEADYNRMLEEQKGKCKICEGSPTNSKLRHFHVDHDHETGKVRGLLCNECNCALGLLKDSPTLLRRAADHIEVNRIVHAIPRGMENYG